MGGAFLEIENLSKVYGETHALSDLFFFLNAGELLVVLGPTGAGKTTLLRIIAGLEVPDAGRVVVEGVDMTHCLPAERDVALVFQNFSLYPNKTVRQNLEFPLLAPGRDLSKSEIADRVAHTAALLRIAPLLDRPATHLSGGEMQRVAIGRAIARQPRLFLMDEPLTNLDAKLREVLRVELIRLQRDLGTPMIYVTHDRVEALSMGDRIAVLSEGKILQIGSPEEIYQRPKSPAVARQLGYPPINLIAVHNRDGHWVTAANHALATADRDAPQRAILGIRPENILPHGGEIPAAIEVVENLGASTIVLATWADQPIHLSITGAAQWRVGDVIYPFVDSKRVLVWGEARSEEGQAKAYMTSSTATISPPRSAER